MIILKMLGLLILIIMGLFILCLISGLIGYSVNKIFKVGYWNIFHATNKYEYIGSGGVLLILVCIGILFIFGLYTAALGI